MEVYQHTCLNEDQEEDKTIHSNTYMKYNNTHTKEKKPLAKILPMSKLKQQAILLMLEIKYACKHDLPLQLWREKGIVALVTVIFPLN